MPTLQYRGFVLPRDYELTTYYNPTVNRTGAQEDPDVTFTARIVDRVIFVDVQVAEFVATTSDQLFGYAYDLALIMTDQHAPLSRRVDARPRSGPTATATTSSRRSWPTIRTPRSGHRRRRGTPRGQVARFRLDRGRPGRITVGDPRFQGAAGTVWHA